MSSRLANSIIGVGAFAILIGLCLFPVAMGDHGDSSLLPLGACALSLGSLAVASGIYVKARTVGPKAGTSTETKGQPKRVRGGCDICHGDFPIIHCKVHQLHLCTECMREHFDVRSCIYVPSTRGQAAKPQGLAAKSRG
jgi:hypothetical protein